MDLEKIKELMKAMEERGMTKLAIKEKSGFEVELERSPAFEVESYSLPERPALPTTQIQAKPASLEAAQKLEVKEGYEITSPMVGTFYGSPSPEDDPFVKVGDSVTEESVVCIIEAMKVMNEVKAGKSGIVAEVFLDSAHPVEFGTKLFRIV
ncbi:MAG: Biotin carboxyl carrier protein of acetyl-CoA carboxylase [Chlamydiae bacterium]|nr:Biotin carboxyl carrier protein of acetyl-CoA carboxylase [Chlamydiota bacterium]